MKSNYVNYTICALYYLNINMSTLYRQECIYGRGRWLMQRLHGVMKHQIFKTKTTIWILFYMFADAFIKHLLQQRRECTKNQVLQKLIMADIWHACQD